MNKFHLFLLIRRNQVLSARRSVLYEANRLARVILLISLLTVVIYMLLISVGLSLAANSMTTFTAPQFFFSLLPFYLVVDFLIRLFFQHTPAQVIKPYLLLPLKKYDCIDCFILHSALSAINFMWLFLTLPYAIMSVVFKFGVGVALNLLLVYQLMIICNSQFYILSRALISRRTYYAILPVSVYALLFLPLLGGFRSMMAIYSRLGYFLTDGVLVLYMTLSLLLILIFFANRRILLNLIRRETSSAEDITVHPISCSRFFNRFGIVGGFIEIEVKSLFRNKNIRHTFIFQILAVAILSVVISFTDIYNDGFSTHFWAVYPFTLVGINLVRIMGVEGNYIECLMARKENIKKLLEAKYYLYSVLQVFPLVLMLPTVISGKYGILMILSLVSFTIGPTYFILMQLAVTNNQTLPMNTKLTKKSGLDANYIELLVQMVALFLPVLLLYIMPALLGETCSYTILLMLGLSFVLFHKFWIKGIYKRMMRRKYINLYGFMTSR